MNMNLQLFAEETAVEAPTQEAPKEIPLEERMAKLEAMMETMQKAPSTYMEELKAKEEKLREDQTKTYRQMIRQQLEEARQTYPGLSLTEEIKNPQFRELLHRGIDVKSAYELIHKDEILTASMAYAAREVERLMTNKLLAEGKRPTENGGSQGPAVSKTDVKAMSPADRKDIVRRVRMGEKISF